ncbi:MAG: hypothetical protein AAF735_04950 [Myxococcota bacterium]
MSVRKFRSVEAMPDTGSVQPGSPRLATLLAEVLEFSAKLSPRRPPRGVHRFSSIEELNRHRERWTKC